MSQLEDANRRLDAALDRLDRLVAQHAGARGELQEALAEVKAENARLTALTSEVSQRLDAAIVRLKAVIED